jgi:hypothetical protein
MRTTLDIDDDVLAIAREIATQRKLAIGKVISDAFRRNLDPQTEEQPIIKNGFRVFPKRPGAIPVTMEMVNKLRDEE